MRARKAGKALSGQNLVEMLFTFPLALVLMFFTVDAGRLWFTYEAAKMAANAGAHTASIYHNPSVGVTQLDRKLSDSDLTVVSRNVTQIPNKHAYQADVTVTFRPFFGSVQIPTVGGPIQVFPASFNINYTAVKDVSVY